MCVKGVGRTSRSFELCPLGSQVVDVISINNRSGSVRLDK